MQRTNRRVFLKRYREGLPHREDFGVEDQDIGEVPTDHVLVKTDTLSIDAWIRTTLTPGSFHETAGLGSTIRAFGVGQVVETNSNALAVGDWVHGMLCAQTLALASASTVSKLDLSDGTQPRDHIGPLGITAGLTAWVGLVAVGQVQAGDTVLVSGAAGAVGSMVVQLAKARGAQVIGIAGGPHKCRYLTEVLGADVAVDYKGSDVTAEIGRAAPGGVDVFFDNVGGELLDIALENLAPADARVVICGAISQYSDLNSVRGPAKYLRLAERNATMRGFVVTHHAARFAEARAEIASLMRDGRLRLPEHEVAGIDLFADALLLLFAGGHTGNLIVHA